MAEWQDIGLTVSAIEVLLRGLMQDLGFDDVAQLKVIEIKRLVSNLKRNLLETAFMQDDVAQGTNNLKPFRAALTANIKVTITETADEQTTKT
jgi:hypothetical protein